MPGIPSFFSKADFFGKLLPGYVAVILYLVLFSPELLLNKENALSFDIFSAVVFIIAGPAIGYTLQIFHRFLVYSIPPLFLKKEKQKRIDRVKLYARVTDASSPDEKQMLDNIEADYDFSISTAIALVLIGLYYSTSRGTFQLITIPIFILSIILFLGGRFEHQESYLPLLHQLDEKYNKSGAL